MTTIRIPVRLILIFSILSFLLVAKNVEATTFDAQGHRGARGLVAENTLASFAKALSVGVNTLELDVGMTRDNIVVVNHNPRLEPQITRDAAGNWLRETGPAIRELSLAELNVFDVGGINPSSRYFRRFPEQTSLDGERIPTLEDVILLVKRSGGNDINLNIETKLNPNEPDLFPGPDEFTKAVLEVIQTHDFSHRVTIQSFDWRTLKLTQTLAPEIRTAYLTAEQPWLNNIQTDQPGRSPWTGGHDIDDYDGNLPQMIKAAGGEIWSAYHKEVSEQSIKKAHELGLLVTVWTVNDSDRMEELIEMGVDGIITDYPDRLLKVMKKVGLPLPPSYFVSP